MSENREKAEPIDREGPSSEAEYRALCERFGEYPAYPVPDGSPPVADWRGEHARELWRRARGEGARAPEPAEPTYLDLCWRYSVTNYASVEPERHFQERWLRERWARDQERQALGKALGLRDGESFDPVEMVAQLAADARHVPSRVGELAGQRQSWEANKDELNSTLDLRDESRSAGFNAGTQHVISKLRAATRADGEAPLAEILAQVAASEYVEGLERESLILRSIAQVYDQGEPTQVLPDLVARSRACEDEAEHAAEQLGLKNSLDVGERVTEILAELGDLRVKARAALEMLGATRSVLAEVAK